MDFAENPLELFLLLSGVPGRENRVGALGKTPIPATVLTGGVGKEGEEQEEVTGYLGVVLARPEATGGVLSAVAVARRLWRRLCSGSAQLEREE